MKTSKDAQAAFDKLNGNQALPAQLDTDIHRDMEDYVREDVEFTKAVYAAFEKAGIKQRLGFKYGLKK